MRGCLSTTWRTILSASTVGTLTSCGGRRKHEFRSGERQTQTSCWPSVSTATAPVSTSAPTSEASKKLLGQISHIHATRTPCRTLATRTVPQIAATSGPAVPPRCRGGARTSQSWFSISVTAKRRPGSASRARAAGTIRSRWVRASNPPLSFRQASRRVDLFQLTWIMFQR